MTPRAAVWHKAGMNKAPWYARHLAEAGEGYFSHAAFAVGMAARCAWAAVALLFHAVFPFWAVCTGSDALRRANALLQARRDACEKAREE
jgi:hypothetical protein